MAMPRAQFTREQVAAHNSTEDCWTIVHDGVYDVTSYLYEHPGGFSLLFRNAGADSTKDFEALFHTPKARGILERYRVGSVAGVTKAKSNLLSPLSVALNPNNPKSAMMVSGPLMRDKDGFAVPMTKKQLLNPSSPSSRQNSAFSDISSLAFGLPMPMSDDQKLEYRKHSLTGVHQLNHDTKLLRFTPGFAIRPGQHISIRADLPGGPVKRQYTPIAATAAYFDLLIKAYPTNSVSAYLHSLQAGQQIQVLGPLGDWSFNRDSYKRIGMLAAGTGIAPMYQIIQDWQRDAPALVFANKSPQDIVLRSKLETLVAHNRLQVVHLLSRYDQEPMLYRHGRISAQLITQTMPPPAEGTLILVCGPDGFRDSAVAILRQLGYTSDMIHAY